MWNLKNKTNEQTKLKRKTVIDTENKQVVARGEEVWRKKEITEGD